MTDEKLLALMTEISPAALQLDEVLRSSKLPVERKVAALLALAALELERWVPAPKMTEAMKEQGSDLATQAMIGGPVVVKSLLGCLVRDINDLFPMIRTVKAAEQMVREAGVDA